MENETENMSLNGQFISHDPDMWITGNVEIKRKLHVVGKCSERLVCTRPGCLVKYILNFLKYFTWYS
jgi:hypothetical protein